MNQQTLLIVIGVFVVVSALFGVVMLMLRSSDNKSTASRLDIIIGGRRKEDAEKGDILRRSAQESDQKAFLEMITPKLLTFEKLFEQADCNIKPSALFGAGLVLALVGVVISSWLVGLSTTLFVSAPLVGGVMFLLPWLWLLNKRRVRLKKFAAQLPDALELVARALRAGHSLAAGMHVVAEEMPSPICDEFNRVHQEQNLGIAIEDAMRSMCDRVPNLDLRFFVTSVAIQRQTGGDLAEILDKIGYVIRERYRILGQVKALTGEGRLSGVVLIALPFVLFAVMLNMNPAYESMLWTTKPGKYMLVGGLILQVLGAICIKKIVDIKV